MTENITLNKTIGKVLCLLFLFFQSCNESQKCKNYRVKSISYVNQRQKLVPSIIKIEINDYQNFIFKNIEKGKLTNVFLYSLKKENANYFKYVDEMRINGKPKTNNELIILTLITGYFDSEIYHKWTKSEIDEFLKTDIGLVIGKDTIRLKKCNEKGNR